MRVLKVFSTVLAAVIPATTVGVNLEAQYLGGGEKTFEETQVADLRSMGTKFSSLADAFPDSLYDWRPMEGVRSVKDVMVLVATESVLFPTMWGYDAPAWTTPGGFGPEQERLHALNKTELIAEIVRGFDHAAALMEGMSDADRARDVNFFGLDVDVATAITLMANDMHEHLGQSIAYARMNRIVPPWSR